MADETGREARTMETPLSIASEIALAWESGQWVEASRILLAYPAGHVAVISIALAENHPETAVEFSTWLSTRLRAF